MVTETKSIVSSRNGAPAGGTRKPGKLADFEVVLCPVLARSSLVVSARQWLEQKRQVLAESFRLVERKNKTLHESSKPFRETLFGVFFPLLRGSGKLADSLPDQNSGVGGWYQISPPEIPTMISRRKVFISFTTVCPVVRWWLQVVSSCFVRTAQTRCSRLDILCRKAKGIL